MIMNKSCAELEENDLFRIFFLLIIAIIGFGSALTRYFDSKSMLDKNLLDNDLYNDEMSPFITDTSE